MKHIQCVSLVWMWLREFRDAIMWRYVEFVEAKPGNGLK